MSIDIDSFLAELDRIPWFADFGKPPPLDGEAVRITSWDAWPGPETPGGALIAEASQIRRQRLLAAGDRPAIEAAWPALVCRRALALPLLLAMGISQPGAGGPPR
jgi:hypothetical protein